MYGVLIKNNINNEAHHSNI